MKTIITIALLALTLASCSEIRQLNLDHRSVETAEPDAAIHPGLGG